MGRHLRNIAELTTLVIPAMVLSSELIQGTTIVTLRGQNSEVASTIKVLPDNSVILVGRTNSSGAGNYDVLAARIDTQGNIVWARTYGGSGWDEAQNALIAADGNIIAVGKTNSFGGGEFDIYVLKISTENGTLLWSRTIGGPRSEEARAIVAVPGGYILAGKTNSFGAGEEDFYIVGIDHYGEVTFTKTFGGTSRDELVSILPADGSLIAVGNTISFGSGEMDIYLLNITYKGELIWNKIVGTPGWEEATGAVYLTDQQAVIVYGFSWSAAENVRKAVGIKLTSDGSKLWAKTYSVGRADLWLNGGTTTSANVFLCGAITSPELGTDYLLIELNTNSGYPEMVLVGGGAGQQILYDIKARGERVFLLGAERSGVNQDVSVYLASYDDLRTTFSKRQVTVSDLELMVGVGLRHGSGGKSAIPPSLSSVANFQAEKLLPLHATATTGKVSCEGRNDGWITVKVTGGKPPYTHSWNTGAISDSLFGLAPGTYTDTIRDAEGNIFILTVNVEMTEPMSIQIDKQDVTCYGGTNGSIAVKVSGGTPPYTHSWNTGDSFAALVGIKAGIYIDTVRDAKGCKKIVSIEVKQPEPIRIEATRIDSSNCNIPTGRIAVQVSGGTPPYRLLWSTGHRSTVVTGLPPGEIELTVEDANGCKQKKSFYIPPVTSPTLVATLVKHPSCYGAKDGIIKVKALGGTPPYTLSWEPPVSTSSEATNLAAGKYTVSVRDRNGCTNQLSVELTEPTPLRVSAYTAPSRCDRPSGSVTLSVSGGTPPYRFQWSTGATSQNLSSLNPGTYSVEVRDQNGCTQSLTVNVPQFSPVEFSLSASKSVIPAGDTTELLLTSSNPSLIVSTSVSPAEGVVTEDRLAIRVAPQKTTTYTVQITDQNGCKAERTITIVAVEPGDVYVPEEFSPNGDGINDRLQLVANGITSLSFRVLNRWGEAVFVTEEVSRTWDGTYLGTPVEAGLYTYILEAKTQDGRTIKKTGTIRLTR